MTHCVLLIKGTITYFNDFDIDNSSSIEMKSYSYEVVQTLKKEQFSTMDIFVNPIPTSQGQNQPLYERHVTKSGRNRVKSS